MTVSAESQANTVTSRALEEHDPTNIPSLMAKSREASKNRAPPSREKVSEAIAMVRARQSLASKSSVRKVTDIIGKKSTKSVDTGASSATPETSNLTVSERSPLAPAGQMGGGSRSPLPSKPNSFFQNVFASRSEVATHSSQPDQDSVPTVPSTADEPEENNAPTSSLAFMNPLEYVKREFQLATQSATQGNAATQSEQHKQKTTATSVQQVPNLEGADSNDSEGVTVDAKTIQNVSQFLDKLHTGGNNAGEEPEYDSDEDETIDAKTMQDVSQFLDRLHSGAATGKKNPGYGSNEDQTIDAKTIEDVGRFIDKLHNDEAKASEEPSASLKPVVQPPKPTEDDFIYGGSSSQDSADSSNGSVNPETMAEVGAFIDAISRVGDGNRAGTSSVAASDATLVVRDDIQSPEDIGSLIDRMNGTKSPEDIGSIIDSMNNRASLENIPTAESDDIEEMDGIPQPPQPEDAPSFTKPVYEQVEAKSFGPGVKKDPPAAMTSENSEQADPPAPTSTLNESIMRMKEAEIDVMAPSYSLESLATSEVKEPAMEDEKKTEEGLFNASQQESASAKSEDYSDAIEAARSSSSADYDDLLREALGSGEFEAKEVVDEAIQSEMDDVVPELASLDMRNLPNSPSMADDTSLPWSIKDIASEETMKAAGRTRTAAENAAVAKRSKARELKSMLSDESSVPHSMAEMPEIDETAALDEEVELGIEVQEGQNGVHLINSPTGGSITLLPWSEDADDGHLKTIDDEEFASDQPGPDAEVDDAFVAAFLDMGSGSGESGDSPVETSSASPIQTTDSNNLSLFSSSNERPTNPVEDKEEALGFLEQFESLDVHDDDADDDDGASLNREGLEIDTSAAPIDPPSAPRTPHDLQSFNGISKYFATLDQEFAHADEHQQAQIQLFQKFVAPVVSGEKPSIIETAQIRQAAIGADIPLDVVDRFLDFAEEDIEPSLTEALSSRSEGLSLTKYDEMEDLDESEAISAFLSRFGTLAQGGHFPDGNIEAVQEFVDNKGSGEENVEIDAEFGYVNKELMAESEEEEEEQEEWWREERREKKKVPKMQLRKSYESDSDDDTVTSQESEAVNKDDPDLIDLDTELPDPRKAAASKDLSRGKKKQTREKKLKAEALKINTNYSASFDAEDEEDWARKAQMAKHGAGWEQHAHWLSPRTTTPLVEPASIDGVAAASAIGHFVFSKRIFRNHKPWKRLYKERTQFHDGYENIDIHSIYDSTAPTKTVKYDLEDYTPWEHRTVQQRFLHEKSFAFSRNWFGDLVNKKQNQKIKLSFVKPKSMEMPISNIPEPGEWTEEWFTQWKSPLEQNTLSQSKSMDTYDAASLGPFQVSSGLMANGSSYTTDNGSVGSEASGESHSDDESSFSGSEGSVGSGEGSDGDEDDDMSWEEAPECGEIINVKQRIGERVSRVHPDYTSSLRRSRWRKKYFPRGTFPY